MKLIKKLDCRPRKNNPNRKDRYGLFHCDYCGCDVEIDVYKGYRNKSCGCQQGGPEDLVGLRFGKLIILKQTSDRSKGGSVLWEARCDCGVTVLADSSHLKSGSKRSCGCLQRDAVTRHGESFTLTYRRHQTIQRRCRFHGSYSNVSICPEWSGPSGYTNFRDWVLSQGFNDKTLKDHHIHRINNAPVYGPTTCRIVSIEEHARIHHQKVKEAA